MGGRPGLTGDKPLLFSANTFAPDTANDSCSATDRAEGGEGVEAEGPLKRKSGVFLVFDMQATSCAAQQLRERARVIEREGRDERSWTFESYLKETGNGLGEN